MDVCSDLCALDFCLVFLFLKPLFSSIHASLFFDARWRFRRLLPFFELGVFTRAGFVGLVAVMVVLFWILFSYDKGKYLGQESVRAAGLPWFWLAGDSVTEQGKKSSSVQ